MAFIDYMSKLVSFGNIWSIYEPVLCYEEHNESEFFESTIPKILLAEYNFKMRLYNSGIVSISDYYNYLGIYNVYLDDATYYHIFLEDDITFYYSKMSTDDGLEYIIISIEAPQI